MVFSRRPPLCFFVCGVKGFGSGVKGLDFMAFSRTPLCVFVCRA